MFCKTKLEGFCDRRIAVIHAIAVVFLCASTQIYANTNTNTTIEDDYIYQFGNMTRYRFWVNAREWLMPDDEPLLRQFISEAHTLAGLGSYPVVDWLQLKERTLIFKDPKYRPRRVDVLEYTVAVEGETTPFMDMIEFQRYKLAGPKLAMTEGRRRECVYYLDTIVNATGVAGKFQLQKEVCGINDLPTPAMMFY